MSINKDSQKVPKLRFKGFTDDWEECKLSDITTINARIGWQNLRTSEFLDNGEYLLITGTDFKDGKIDYSNIHYIGKERYDQDKNIQIKNGSILITKDGTLGKVAYVEALRRPATLNAGVFNVQVTKEAQVNSKYLFHYLKAPFLLKYAASHSTGGTIKHLNKNILVDFPIPIPANTEQIKIATLLSNFDKAITLHQRKLDQLNQLKEALLQQMFPGKGETVPKLRFAGFEGDWDLEPFSELWKQTNEKNKNFEFLPTEVISVSRMKLNPSNRNPKDKYMTTYNIFRKGDIAFEGNKSKKHDFGRFVLNDIQDGIVSHVFVVYRPQANFNSDFMKAYINSEQVMREHLKHSTTKTLMMTTLNNHEIKKRKLKMPTLSEQIKIGDMLKHLDDIITLQQRKLDQLKNTKQVLLQNMFI